MGAVYQATQVSLDRLVAIKILPPEFVRDPALRALFEDEAKAMARLNHPNLIAVHDFGKAGDIPYIIMEYVHGCSLHHSAKGMAIDPAEVTRILLGVCAGLTYAHQHGVIHCDIKPANILLTQQVQPKIGDFGLARRTGPSASADSPAFGSEHYSAPEIIRQAAKLDARADIYSAGIVLHELLTGRRPADDPRSASALSRCDPRFDLIIKRATMPDPAMRYASIQEMAHALAAIRATSGAAKAAAAERIQQARATSEKPQNPPNGRDLSAASDSNSNPPKSKRQTTHQRYVLWMALGLLGLVAAIGMALTRHSPTGKAKKDKAITEQADIPSGLKKGLLLYYGFDADEPKVKDKSGNGNDGSMSECQWVTEGKVGGACEFDGKTSYISVLNCKSMNFGYADFTYSFWVMPHAIGHLQGLIGHAFNPEAQLKNDGKIQMNYHEGGNGILLSSTTLSPDKFYFVTLTRAKGTGRVYINGERENSVNADFECSSAKPLVIGRHSAWASDYFDGLLDDVMIWNRALSEEEVKQLYKVQGGGKSQ